jgi:IS5 family transposase
MIPKMSERTHPQDDFFKVKLTRFINLKHPLVRLSEVIDWSYFNESFGPLYVSSRGRPGLPTRLMAALTYLKYTYDLSDERLVEDFIRDPYIQYFCGYEFFQHQFPCDASSLTRWRKRVGEAGCEKLLSATLQVGHELGLLKARDCQRVIVDTTVQEKAIAFPTDAKLVYTARAKLVECAQAHGIPLRQSYARVDKALLAKQARYAHARQYRRARRALKKLKTHLGRVIRDIERKCPQPDERLQEILMLSKRVHKQRTQTKNKLYSLHEPQVACIAKGKRHKPYEFGSKVSITTTAKKNWVLGTQSWLGNPFDGSTLKGAIEQTEAITGVQVTEAFVDKGYRGKKHHPEHVHVYISGRKRLRPVWMKLLKRRSAIEPIIGHMKHDHRMLRNRLKGMIGDQMNPILAGCGFNLRKILNAIFLFLIYRFRIRSFLPIFDH